MTPTDIKNNPNYLAGLELAAVNIAAYMLYRGGAKVEYHMFYNGVLLFSGLEFKPSPLHNIDSMQSFCDLLGFLTAQPGDTDPEYFKDHTPEQLAFVACDDAAELRILISDAEDRNSVAHDEALEILNKAITR